MLMCGGIKCLLKKIVDLLAMVSPQGFCCIDASLTRSSAIFVIHSEVSNCIIYDRHVSFLEFSGIPFFQSS